MTGLLAALTACSPAKYLPQDNHLLSKNRVEITGRNITEDQVNGYVVQKPNKKILGMRFHLFLYNLSNLEKTKWPHNWLRRIGEEPVVYNPVLTASSLSQIKQFLQNKGYYNAAVKDTVYFQGNNARVQYSITTGDPYRVQSIEYFFEDTGLVSLILPDTINSLLGKGMKFDKDVLQNERIRIESLLKEQGYYRFSKEYIYFQANTFPEEKSVDLVMGFKEYVEGSPDPRSKVKHHPKYMIGKVYVFPDYAALSGTGAIYPSSVLDTVFYRDQYFLYPGKFTMRPAVITNFNNIVPGQFYKQSNVNRTYRNLSELGPIRYTNIVFTDDSVTLDRNRLLDCRIELTRKKVQSYQAEVAGTNSSGDLGIRGNISYQNLNLFRGAETFNIRFTGAIEALKNRTDKKYTSMREIGAETSIVFPKFFAPLRLSKFARKYSPKTALSASFNYQSRPDYTRSIANASFSYQWKTSEYLTHTFWPVELNYVQIYEDRSSAEFLDSIKTTPLGYSFEDHMVNVARYGFELNNQHIGKSKDFIFLRSNLESAGNLVYLVNSIVSSDSASDQYLLFNVPYFQYLRGDVDFRYYNIIDKQNKFAYRFYAGMGFPYGNSTSLPYEKKFFAGGPNSLRAWTTRDLGPGSYVDTTTSTSEFAYPNKNGDIKIEANVEYRFKIFWKMEGAIFLDAGNIWALNEVEGRQGAEFKWNRFYREIAVGTGLGVRFDFSFFLMRIDFGLKLRDPSLPENERWLPLFRNRGFNDLHLNFGIGYPF